ncbi:MAG: hypothetical protein RL204_1292, partial [Bacteroidota bacterium]
GISDAYTALRSGEKTKSPIQGGLKYKLKILLGIEQIKLLAEIKKELSQTEFDKQLKLSYQNGFNFLTGNYKNRPEIKEWIHKENYIE